MIYFIKQLLLLSLLLPIYLIVQAEEPVVTVWNWADYMPTAILHTFEKETGIKARYNEFDSNAALYIKLKTNPRAAFDIIVPSSYYVDRMRREGMLRLIDKTALPNFKYINPNLLDKPFDPHNRYSIPYLWGTTGIVVNDKYANPKQFQYWKDLWNPLLKNQLLMLNDEREVFSIAMITLGYSINDKNPKHIKQAYLKLKTLMPNIKLFNSNAANNIYIDEDVTLGMGWSGDIYISIQENKHLHYIYPKPRFPMWIDSLAIPKHAPHYKNALRLINFLMRPDIAKRLSEGVGYSSPNQAAMNKMPEKLKRNPVFNPGSNVLQHAETENDLGPSQAILEKYWQKLKLGSE